MGLPLLVCCCCRVRSECASEPASPCRRGAPLSHCRVGSAGCVGIWQLCDAARTVGCRSRFVLVAQQANSYSKCRAPTPHDVERRRGLSHASEESSRRRLEAWTNDGIFITLWKLAAWPHGTQTRCYFAVAAASMRKVHVT